MDRSQSILKSLVAAALLTAGLLSAGAALAQRAITNSAAGNDDPPTPLYTNDLVQCSVLNTKGLVAGEADACSRQDQVGETIAAVQALADGYSATRSYALAVSSGADTLRIDDDDGISSGGLFSAPDSLGFLFYLQPRVGSFVLAASGHYSNDDTDGASLDWSAYYLFDDVTFASVEVNGFAFMPVRLFELGSDGVTRTFTNGLVIDQVSVYDLQRVPEAGSLALAGLALAVLALVRRRRRG